MAVDLGRRSGASIVRKERPRCFLTAREKKKGSGGQHKRRATAALPNPFALRAARRPSVQRRYILAAYAAISPGRSPLPFICEERREKRKLGNGAKYRAFQVERRGNGRPDSPSPGEREGLLRPARVLRGKSPEKPTLRPRAPGRRTAPPCTPRAPSIPAAAAGSSVELRARQDHFLTASLSSPHPDFCAWI